jgi:hypothetical protein
MSSDKSTTGDGATSNEAIGRPGKWREGRYQEAGQPVSERVNDPSQREERSPDPRSTRVTRKDYEDLTPPPERERS